MKQNIVACIEICGLCVPLQQTCTILCVCQNGKGELINATRSARKKCVILCVYLNTYLTVKYLPGYLHQRNLRAPSEKSMTS